MVKTLFLFLVLLLNSICSKAFDNRFFHVHATQNSCSAGSQTFTSSGTWTKPSAAFTTATIEIWGGGGSGGTAYNGGATSCGGAGGAYKKYSVAYGNLNSSETITVGSGGNRGSGDTPGVAGGYSVFGNAIWASGGAGGAGQHYGAAAAGSYTPTDGRSASVWTLVSSEAGASGGCGGSGAGGSTTNSGPGGGGGINSSGVGGVGGAASATGATGGHGAASWSGVNSTNGTSPGAGGGGNYWSGNALGDGASGQVKISWTCP